MLVNKPRLKAVYNEIDGKTLVDVGCDHGKISVQALIDKKVSRVIATDISQKSLNKAIELSKKYNIENIEFKCGNGLDVIKDNEADTVLIAGMGGMEIIDILKRKPKGIKKIILCPHSNTIELREFLVSNNFKISKDYIVKEDKIFYSIIVANVDEKSVYKEKELLLGQDNKNNADYIEYLNYLSCKYEKLLKEKLDEKSNKKYTEYLGIIKKEIDESK